MNSHPKFLTRSVLAAAFFGLLTAATPALAAGEIFGRVGGFVYDPTKAPLADVPLTIHGTALMQAKTVTTGDDGRYEIDQLPPGSDYILEVTVPGFNTIRKIGIVIQTGQMTPVDVNLTVFTESQAATYEIVEKVNPALNPDSAQTGAVINHEKAEMTPVFHQVQNMANQVAGVGPGTTPSVLGGLKRFAHYYVDGMDTTDPTDGTFTAPMNFDVVENFEILTGGLDAQYGSLGLVQNVVTKSGSNKFTYDVNLTWSAPALNGHQQVALGQPEYLQELTNYNGASPLTSFFSPVLNLGGPIIKDKLWFYVSGQLNRSIVEHLLNNYYMPLEIRTTPTWTSLERLKLTWQASSKDLVSFAVNVDHNNIDNTDNSAFTTDSGESRTHRGGFFLIGNWDHTFSDNLLFQLQTGMTNKSVNQDPENGGISHTDLSYRVTQFSAGSISQSIQGNFLHESKQRYQFDPTLSLKEGHHQFKAGIQLAGMVDGQVTGVTGTQRFADFGGVCDPTNPATFAYCYQRTDFYDTAGNANSLTTDAHVFTEGLFVQDRWNVNHNLTIIPGVRLDLGQNYGQQGDVVNLWGLGPRLSFTYDVAGDRKKLITGHYGRSNEVGNIFVAQHSNPGLVAVTSTFNSNTDAFPVCVIGSTQPGCVTSGGVRQFTTNPTTPHVDELSLGYRQEIAPLTVGGLDLTYRKYSNQWADLEVNRIYDASGTRIVGYVNSPAQQILQAATPDSAQREYKGMNLWIQGNPGHWDLLASYTLSFTTGTVDDYFDGYLNNPRMTQFYQGYSSDDRRHALKGVVSYNTDVGLDLGFHFTYLTGDPLWESFTNPADPAQKYYRSPRGTCFTFNGTGQNFNDPTTWANCRDPDTVTLDVLARYNLGKLLGTTGQRMEVSVFAFNILNTVNAQSLSPGFNRNVLYADTSTRQNPLQIEFFFRVRNF